MDPGKYITTRNLLSQVALLKKASDFFIKDDARSVLIKVNVALSFVFRGAGYLISFAMVPLLLKDLGPVNYGIWLTLASFMLWLELFDFGLGDGLKNKFAEARARRQEKLAREYVSTAYVTALAMVSVMAIVFYGIGYFTNWTAVFNARKISPDSLRTTVFLVFGFAFVEFLFNVGVSVLVADQKPAFKRLFDVLGLAVSFGLVVMIFKWHGPVSLPVIAVIRAGPPALVLMLANIFCFSSSGYRSYRPSFKFINTARLRELTHLGVRFFILNMTTIVLYMTDNIVISHILSPAAVTVYGVCQKYFTILFTTFILIIGPFWVAFTDAYAKNDMDWIKRNMRRNMKLWAVYSSLNVIFLIAANHFYSIWVGDQVTVPFRLSAIMAFTVALMNWKLLFQNFLSGIGKLRLQLYLGIFTAIVNIPLSIFLGKTLGMGSAGVITATAICLLLYSVFLPVQYGKIMSNSARGLWNA